MHRPRRSFRTSRCYLLLAIIALIFAQACDDDTSTGDQTLSDTTSNDTTSPDGGGTSDSGTDPTDSGTNPTDTQSDATTDTTNSGAADTTTDTSPNGPDASQPPGCPVYPTECNGVCVPTSTDPDNCGGCGIICGESEVCSGGTCTDSSMPGLAVCDPACVDFDSYSDYCGACGNACGQGEGCVEGACEQAADLDPRDQACAGGGPAIDLGDTVTVERQCSGELAERTFRWAVCSCEDLISNSGMNADAYDSTLGPYTPGGIGGGVATNGMLRANSGFTVTGMLWAADELNTGTAAQTNMAATIGQRLHAGSTVRLGSGTTIGGDVYVNGDIERSMTIGGTLYSPSSASINTGVTFADRQEGPVDVALPCDACGVDERIPVGAIVANRSGANNDNALIGLDEDLFSGESDG